MKYLLSCILIASAQACSVGLTTPDNAVITCNSDAECPTNYKCEVGAGRCFDTRVSVPRVFIDPIARSVGDVAVSITLADNEGDPATVSGEYDIGNGYVPATLDGSSDLTSSRGGDHHVITWHAGADIGSNAFRDSVSIRLTARGSGGTGPVAQSDVFAFGDDAPVVTGLNVVGTQPLAGNIIIDFNVSDSSSDAIAVSRLEVSYDGTFDDTVVIFDAAQTQAAASVLPSGAVVDLQSSPDGVAHAFTWSSAVTSIVDAPNSVLRLTVRDAFSASAPANSQAFALRNQLPPRVTGLISPAATIHRATGPTPFSYRLVDENGDPADVIFEYSPDGTHFSPCVEYPVPESEGTVGLATASEAVGGVEHVFVWDPTGAPSHGGAVTVRARASTPSDSGQTVALPANAGEPPDASYPILTFAGVSVSDIPLLALGDFNGDHLTDLLTVSEAGQGPADVVTYACAVTGCMGGIQSIYETPPPGPIVSLAAADLDEDGLDDSIVVRDGVWVRHTRASALYLAQSTTGIAHTGDFDGDGHLDVVLQQANAIAVLFGDGHGGLTAPVTTSAPSADGVALAHVNGDSAADLYVSYSGHFALFESTGNRASPFMVTDLAVVSDAVFDACDLNGDGVSDLLVRDGYASLDQYVLDTGDTLRGPFPLNINSPSIFGVACADLDADGTSDLTYAVLNFTAGQVYVAFNRGPDDSGVASFQDGVLVNTIASGESASVFTKGRLVDGSWVTAAAVADMGVIDVIGTARTAGTFTASLASPIVGYGASGTQFTEYVIADFDNDGIEDQLFNNGGNDLELWHGDGVRGLASGAISRTRFLPISASGLATGDANGDGNADIWYSSMLAYGNGDGTFAPAIAAARPAGFRSQPMVMSYGPPIPGADFDGDGVYDCVPGSNNVVQLQPGAYNTANPPGLGTFADPFPASCGTAVTIGTAALQPYNLYFVADLNDDGLPDLVQSTRRTVTIFGIYFGQNVPHRSRHATIGRYSGSAQPLAPVTAMAEDIIGETVAFHVARASVDDVLVWEDDLVTAGLLASADTQRQLTIPYELRGDVRLTASSPAPAMRPPLHVEPRLGARVGTGTDFSHAGLDANQRGLVIDLPVMAGIAPGTLSGAGNRVFMRVTDYDKLGSGVPKRRFTWTEVPRDADGDLTTGSGVRYVTSANVVRVLTDRGGIFVSYTP